MSQSTTVVADGTGAEVLTRINAANATLLTNNSGASAPSTPSAYQFWADTAAGILKQRNAANTAWISLFKISDYALQSLCGVATVDKSSAYTVVDADKGKVFNCTGGTFTLSLTAAATLGGGYAFAVRNSGAGVITIDPNGSETIDGVATVSLAAGESCIVSCNGTAFVTVGRPVASSYYKEIQPVAASVGSSELTVTLNPTTLDFRSATLGSGTVNTRTVAAAILVVVPSTATLGCVNAVASRLAVLALDNSGTVELAVVNMAGGNNLDETTLITTTTIGTGADSNNVVYSTTGRTSVPFRVVGFVESTQATAGTWASAPSTIQGQGGQALAAMSSFGYGQTWQNVTGSRVIGTTYYNTTGKPIHISIGCAVGGGGPAPTVGGVTSPSVFSYCAFFIVGPGQSYSATAGGAIQTWMEFR